MEVCALRIKTEEVRSKIRMRMYTETTQDGLLTKKPEEYLTCVDIKSDNFDKLIMEDQKHWADELKEAKDTLATFKANLQALLSRQTDEIESILELDDSKRKYSLRKLALWGEQVEADAINFEWPKEEDMIWPKVKLQSLELKSNSSVLSSVRCVLSNGISSPVFENENVTHDEEGSMNLGGPKPVRFAQAHDEESDTISRIFVMDEQRQEIASYNPFEMRNRGPVLKLRDEETLIGVYGVMGKKDYFTSFGFIVKAWEIETSRE